ncbi:hypothetical protein RB2654_14540 [Rhodobacterales bacterium HTCC2654]|uniref:Uncharacterized protein n=1 Tax=Maritimibacter alkaliphilus HTCC2654 TaxID=314271 RepID=A3VGV7_9RHOB|nr:hypothetical protein RB2654_14540 [Rhodobacterales bacterium HTCC2654] [Maritimibacter alkaliphilus HTCC2654]
MIPRIDSISRFCPVARHRPAPGAASDDRE